MEYNIQNDVSEGVRDETGSVSLQRSGQPQYPNMYILPKKYANTSDVSVADVIRSFPLRFAGKAAPSPLINPHLEKI